MGVLITAAAIVISVVVGIYAERRRPAQAADAARRSLVLILYFLLPPVIFFNLASADIDLDHGVGLGLALLVLTLVSLAVWQVASRVLKLSPPQTGAVICAVLVGNTAFLGYPMTVALLGHDHLSDAVLFDVLVAGPALLLGAFAVGAAFGTEAGETPRERVRAFFTRNPPLYAAILGLLAPRALAPDAVVDVVQALVVVILPIGFFAVGATIAEDAEHGELRIPPALTRPVLVTLVGRLVLFPGLLMLIAAPLIDLPSAYRLSSAMPTGINALIVSHAYGLDNRIVAEAVVWSTSIVIVAALVSLAF